MAATEAPIARTGWYGYDRHSCLQHRNTTRDGSPLVTEPASALLRQNSRMALGAPQEEQQSADRNYGDHEDGDEEVRRLPFSVLHLRSGRVDREECSCAIVA